jgi:hypothetical protein
MEEWWNEFLEEVFSDDLNTPSKGVQDSAESWDDEHVQKQLLSIGSKGNTAKNAKQNPATDRDAAKGDANSAKTKAAAQSNDAKKAQGLANVKKQAQAMAKKVANEITKALTPQRPDTSTDLAANLNQDRPSTNKP